ncbi:MAG: carboxypeptidase-like regulatory domain-containing protein [Turneriella sp.]
MKHKAITFALLITTLLFAAHCGKVSGGEDEKKESKAAGIVSPDDPAASATGAPPAYVSHQTISSTQFEVTLTKECTDATGLNSANFILSNGLQITNLAKKSGDARTIVVTTTIQQSISYTLTMLNLVGTDGGTLQGVLQVTFTGLPSPAITSIDWRDPANTANPLPGTLGAISLCVLSSGSGANCTNAPFYNRSSLYGILTGANAVSYRYKIDAGAWSGEIPIATPLNLTGLSEGYHTLYIVGKHNNGYWQADTAGDVYTKSWVQDTVAPDAYLDPLTLPASVTASLSLSVRAIGADVSYFRYCLDNGTINDCVTNNWRGNPDAASAGLAIPNAVYTANLVPGSVRVRVIGIDASGNVQAAPISGGTYTYTIDTGAVEAVFQLSDLTAITPQATSVTINVLGSSGAAAYKGKIVDGTDCNAGTGWDVLPEQPLTTPITATGLTDTIPQKTVCAIGKSVSGLYWQGGWSGTATASIVTKYTWTIDTTPPVVQLNWISPIAQPTTTTQTSGYELQVSSTGAAVSYRYALVTGAGASCASATYNAEVTADTAITFGSPAIATTGVTVYKVCAIGKDSAGNWQSTSSATATAEWTVDVDPPANNPSFTAASMSVASFSTPVINFYIDNATATADTKTYRIQVATNSSFSPASAIISDTNVPSCKNIDAPDCPVALATKTFTIAVDSYISGTVYARVQAGDAYGNFRSDYSTVSAEHYVKGQITGTVKTTAGVAISGVNVRLYDSDGSPLNALHPDQSTNASGVFTFTGLHTAKNRYRVIAAFSDATYRPAAKRGISVQAEGSGATIKTNIGTLNLVPLSSTVAQDLVAKVIDADDGWMLGYAEVKLIDYLGNTVGSAVRSTYNTGCTSIAPVGDPPTNIPKNVFNGNTICGDVRFANVTPGNYSIEVTGNSWASGNQTYNLLKQENVVVPGLPEARILMLRAGNTTATNIYIPATNKIIVGPTLTGAAGAGAHTIAITSGPQISKTLVVRGNNQNSLYLFDPVSNSTSAAGFNLTAAAGVGAHSFAITSGLQNGKVLIVHGNNLTSTTLYDPATHTVAAGPALSAQAGDGAHAITISTGVNSGKTLVVHARNTNTTSLYDPATNTFAAGPTFAVNVNTGAFAFAINSGTQAGKTRIVLGNGNNTALFDPNGFPTPIAVGSTLSGTAGAGAHAFSITTGSEAGKQMFVHGGNSNSTSIYDPATDSFGIGPSLSANAGAGANSFLIEAGTHNGKQFVVLGNNNAAASSTSFYDPSLNTFSTGTLLTGAANTGGYSFKLNAVTSGRLPLVRTLTGQDLKMVLTWGNADPRDLDLHLVGTLPAGQTLTNVNNDDCGTGNNTLFHVWAARPNVGLSWQQQYSAKTRSYIQGDALYAGSNYFPTSPDTTTALVQDANTGFGPEAINFVGGYTDGTYYVSVVNWRQWIPAAGMSKESQQWDATDVALRMYDADGLVFEMSATEPAVTPTALAPATVVAGCGAGGASDWQQCELWQAFKMTVSGTGSAGRTFTPVNTYVNWQDGTGGHDERKCNLNGF